MKGMKKQGGFRHFCLILTFYGPLKREKMAALRKL
jgi:hypothetical protein